MHKYTPLHSNSNSNSTPTPTPRRTYREVAAVAVEPVEVPPRLVHGFVKGCLLPVPELHRSRALVDTVCVVEFATRQTAAKHVHVVLPFLVALPAFVPPLRAGIALPVVGEVCGCPLGMGTEGKARQRI